MSAEIRPFAERDRTELRELFERAGQGSPSASLWGHEESEAAVYLTPYMDLEPESLFVAVVDGVIVGYLTGSLASGRIPSESDRMDHAIKSYRLIRRTKPLKFFVRAGLDMARARVGRQEQAAGDFADVRWPAHLHINVVPEARGTGIAVSLMERWLDRLIETGSPGCHLQTLVENTRAVRFFERMGFAKYGTTPLVPGIRRHGKRLHQQTMVWSPPSSQSAEPR